MHMDVLMCIGALECLYWQIWVNTAAQLLDKTKSFKKKNKKKTADNKSDNLYLCPFTVMGKKSTS